jgi:hypothetical protein
MPDAAWQGPAGNVEKLQKDAKKGNAAAFPFCLPVKQQRLY